VLDRPHARTTRRKPRHSPTAWRWSTHGKARGRRHASRRFARTCRARASCAARDLPSRPCGLARVLQVTEKAAEGRSSRRTRSRVAPAAGADAACATSRCASQGSARHSPALTSDAPREACNEFQLLSHEPARACSPRISATSASS
jgi:hypothetical protein